MDIVYITEDSLMLNKNYLTFIYPDLKKEEEIKKLKEQQYSYSCLDNAVFNENNNKITFYCYDNKPTTDIPILMKQEEIKGYE